MMKKCMSVLIALCQLVFICNVSFAKAPPIVVMVDNSQVIFDTQPFMQNGRVLVPFRAIAKALNIEVDWDTATRTVTASKNDQYIKIQIGKSTALINNIQAEMDVPAMIKDGRTFVPVRFFSENFDATVTWEANPPTVIIKSESMLESQSNISTSGKLFSSPTELSILIGSHPSWPYNYDWAFWKYFREATGANINVTVIPNVELSTKVSLIMACPDELPDLIHMLNKASVDNFAPYGGFVAIDDHLSEMPNYTRFWNSVPKEARDAYLVSRRSGDGKTYFPQVYGYDRVLGLQTWMNRKDIFENNNLTVPETLDDMYDVALKLKKLYPNSYPICLRNGLSKINVIGPEFKPYFNYGIYYDFPNKKWSYGATEPTMLEIIKYLNKLRDAGLIPPDYLTIRSSTWEELVSTDRGFMMPEFLVRFDFFNIPNRQRDPSFTWAIMAPPRANTAGGQDKVAKMNNDSTGYVICNTGKKDRIKNAIKLVDWMYSDAATDLLSWGKEGETYKVEDGKRKFIVEDGVNPTVKYGVLSYGLYQRLDPAVVTAAYSDEQASMTDFAIDHLETQINPATWLAFNEEEATDVENQAELIKMFVDENLSKFLLGQEPLSNWDAFQAELNEMGVNSLLKAYSSAYERVMK